MNRKYIIPLSALFALLLILLGLRMSGGVVTDRSVEKNAQGFLWQGVQYNIGPVGGYKEGRILAQTKDGWSVSALEEDPDHLFLVIRTMMEEHLCVREDYTIPTEGAVTAIYWANKRVEDPELCAAIKTLTDNFQKEAIFTAQEIRDNTEDHILSYLSIAYEDCPVCLYTGWCLGRLDGRWTIGRMLTDPDTGEELDSFALATVPEELQPLLAQHLS